MASLVVFYLHLTPELADVARPLVVAVLVSLGRTALLFRLASGI